MLEYVWKIHQWPVMSENKATIRRGSFWNHDVTMWCISIIMTMILQNILRENVDNSCHKNNMIPKPSSFIIVTLPLGIYSSPWDVFRSIVATIYEWVRFDQHLLRKSNAKLYFPQRFRQSMFRITARILNKHYMAFGFQMNNSFEILIIALLGTARQTVQWITRLTM